MKEIFELINEMSPYLLLGFFLAGLMHAFVPNTLYSRYLAKNKFSSVIYSALFGVPLPLCSCGVIPTSMSLRREGASKGATVSFLVSTPQTGVDSIIATYSLMGLPFAIVRPIVAFCTAIFAGQMVNVFDNSGDDENVIKNSRHHKDEHEHLTFMQKIKEAFVYGFVEMMEDIGKWLVIGLIVAGLITVLVPDSFFELFKDNSFLSILFVLLFSIPMYLCATGSIPIAVALMIKGLTPGAALVLLMAGPASNMASILVINKVLGKKTLLIYLSAIVGGAILFGLGIDYLLPREWFIPTISATKDCCEEGSSWFSIGCTIVMCLLLLNAFTLRFRGHGHHHCHCGCEDEHDSCCEHGGEHHHEGHSCCCGEHDDDYHHHDEGHSCCCESHDENEHHHEKGSVSEQNVQSSGESHSATTVYHISGMNCNHCRKNAELAISEVDGVESVSVTLDNGEALVTGNASEDEIRKAVESLGFELK